LLSMAAADAYFAFLCALEASKIEFVAREAILNS
jgi:hypothetical protein